MKILVIGKNGQLGQEIDRVSKNTPYEIISFSKEELDITDYKKVEERIKKVAPNIVINGTALHASYESEKNPKNIFEVNTFAVKNLARVCSQQKIAFITYSTDYVFSGLKGTPYNENDHPTPLQMFGISKYMGELMARNYCENTMVIRTSGLYGGFRGSRSKGNFVLNLIQEAKTKKRIDVSSDQIFSPTYVEDLVSASFGLIRKKAKPGIYHIANDGYCSWAEFAAKIVELMKLDVSINPVNRNGVWGGVRRPSFAAFDNSKVKGMGIKIPTWQKGLEKYIQFLGENK